MKGLSELIKCALIAGVVASGVVQAAEECVPAHKFETLTPGVLTVAAYAFPPYSIPKGGNDISGVEGEILKVIAKNECLTIKTTVVDPSAVIQSVVSKRVDIGIGDWYRTAERNKILGLSAPIYLDAMGIISAEGVTKISDLNGKKIGTAQGNLWVSDLKKIFGDNLVLYPNAVAAAQDLASNRLEAVADSFAVAIAAQQKGAYANSKIVVADADERVRATMQPGQVAFVYTKSNELLGSALSNNILAMHGDGQIKKIVTSFGLSESITEVGEPRLVE